MFMVFSKEKILSYLVSLGTVALLFVMSFAITTRNNEILETSANTITMNKSINNEVNTIKTNANSSNQILNNIVNTNNKISNNIEVINEAISNQTLENKIK